MTQASSLDAMRSAVLAGRASGEHFKPEGGSVDLDLCRVLSMVCGE